MSQGLHPLFTPGVYRVDQTIQINRANTIVLGLGLATIVPDNGITAMRVGDIDGVRLAGFLIDAGTVNSTTLLEVGPQNASADHAANPATVQDVYIRIGGAGPRPSPRARRPCRPPSRPSRDRLLRAGSSPRPARRAHHCAARSWRLVCQAGFCSFGSASSGRPPRAKKSASGRIAAPTVTASGPRVPRSMRTCEAG